LSQAPLTAEAAIAKYRPLIKARARHFWRGYLATRCALEDLEAVATIAVWEATKHHRADGPAKFGTYVTRAIENELIKVVSHWSRRRRKASLMSLSAGPDGEVAVDLESPDPNALERASAADWRAQVRAAVDKLKTRQRRIITLRYWQDQLQAEVGEDLGVTRQRVQQLEAEALNALRPKLRHLWNGSRAA
jgi:RNA polymerase sigma factor (sigma-70 family)